MNIGLNAIGFIPYKTGGIEYYFRNLLHHLQLLDHTNTYTIFCNPHNLEHLKLAQPNFHLKVLRFTRRSFLWYVRGVVRQILKIDILSGFYDKNASDVIHHPSVVFVPMGLKTPSVVTYHDMQHEFYPQFFSSTDIRIRKSTDEPVLRAAVRVIAISHFTKRCIVERFSLDENKIDVIYEGYGPRFKVIRDYVRLKNIRKKYRLMRPFMFYPSGTWPHKNHINLLSALKLLIDRQGFDGELVLTGISMKSHKNILNQIENLSLGKHVKILGFIDYDDLPALYSLARMLVYPSLFEGFGLPLVEAMACGCPVVCSHAASLPEVMGDKGIFFDPASIEDMAEKILRVWNDDDVRQKLKLQGFERSRMFTWTEAAQKTSRVYEKAIS
jgi:glycosyltransferase involved in cell wall biosynthesis